ncbi:MAG: formylglycine-generating enzyme family protein [Candidatus Edwardsbacteria bacterium]
MRKPLFFLFVFLPALAFAQRIPLAILDLEAQDVPKGTAAVISELLRSEFRKSQKFDLVEKNKMDEILKEWAFRQTGCTEAGCATEAGIMLNVKKMIIGSLGKLGTKYILSLRVVDVDRRSIDYTEEEKQVVSEEDLDKLIPPIVLRIIPHIRLGIAPSPLPEAETGGLKVYSTPAGAVVFLDGQNFGETPQALSEIVVGEHQLVLVKDGYKNYETRITVAKNVTKTISASLVKQYGSLRITSQPVGAEIVLDGVPRGVTTEEGLLINQLLVGSHKLRATKPGYESYEVEVTTTPDEVTEINAVLPYQPGSIVITSTPSSATVYVDGSQKGTTPCSVTGLSPGNYSVRVERGGYQDGEISISVGAGQSVVKNVILKSLKALGEGERERSYTPLTPLDRGEFRNEKDGSVLIEIPAGNFTMGSNDYNDEKPVHPVYLDKYYIGKYEVTVGQFRKFCKATGRKMPEQPNWNNRDDHPVVKVSWNEAKAYCDWAGLRLPTEAEWEKAARGTDGRKYPWGNEEPEAGGFYRANYGEGTNHNVWKRDGYEYTSPVGTYDRGKSPYGCYDMAGNVWEWCADWYDENYYRSSPNNNPAGPSSGSFRLLRGGSWGLNPAYLRVSNRYNITPGGRNNDIGFRVSL